MSIVKHTVTLAWITGVLALIAFLGFRFVGQKVDEVTQEVTKRVDVVTTPVKAVSNVADYAQNEVQRTWEIEVEKTQHVWEDLQYLWKRDVLGKTETFENGKWVLVD